MTTSQIIRLQTDRVPAPGGHYSQGTAHGGILFVSGQLPIATGGEPTAQLSFEDQARLALRNFLGVVEAGGGSAAGVLKVTAYIVGIENWPAFNTVFAEVFGDARPARAVVPVPELHYGYLVEIDGFAAAASPE